MVCDATCRWPPHPHPRACFALETTFITAFQLGILSALRHSPFVGHKRLVVVSSVTTWAKTRVHAGGHAHEGMFHKRAPFAGAAGARALEDEALRLRGLRTRGGGSLDACVVGCGILIGCGEDLMLPLFLDAWLQRPVRVPGCASAGRGGNVVPTLNARDLGAFLVALADPPAPPPRASRPGSRGGPRSRSGSPAKAPAGSRPASADAAKGGAGVGLAGILAATAGALDAAPPPPPAAAPAFPKPYMLAVNEASQATLRGICEAVSAALGTGAVEGVGAAGAADAVSSSGELGDGGSAAEAALASSLLASRGASGGLEGCLDATWPLAVDLRFTVAGGPFHALVEKPREEAAAAAAALGEDALLFSATMGSTTLSATGGGGGLLAGLSRPGTGEGGGGGTAVGTAVGSRAGTRGSNLGGLGSTSSAASRRSSVAPTRGHGATTAHHVHSVPVSEGPAAFAAAAARACAEFASSRGLEPLRVVSLGAPGAGDGEVLLGAGLARRFRVDPDAQTVTAASAVAFVRAEGRRFLDDAAAAAAAASALASAKAAQRQAALAAAAAAADLGEEPPPPGPDLDDPVGTADRAALTALRAVLCPPFEDLALFDACGGDSRGLSSAANAAAREPAAAPADKGKKSAPPSKPGTAQAGGGGPVPEASALPRDVQLRCVRAMLRHNRRCRGLGWLLRGGSLPGGLLASRADALAIFGADGVASAPASVAGGGSEADSAGSGGGGGGGAWDPALAPTRLLVLDGDDDAQLEASFAAERDAGIEAAGAAAEKAALALDDADAAGAAAAKAAAVTTATAAWDSGGTFAARLAAWRASAADFKAWLLPADAASDPAVDAFAAASQAHAEKCASLTAAFEAAEAAYKADAEARAAAEAADAAEAAGGGGEAVRHHNGKKPLKPPAPLTLPPPPVAPASALVRGLGGLGLAPVQAVRNASRPEAEGGFSADALALLVASPPPPQAPSPAASPSSSPSSAASAAAAAATSAKVVVPAALFAHAYGAQSALVLGGGSSTGTGTSGAEAWWAAGKASGGGDLANGVAELAFLDHCVKAAARGSSAWPPKAPAPPPSSPDAHDAPAVAADAADAAAGPAATDAAGTDTAAAASAAAAAAAEAKRRAGEELEPVATSGALAGVTMTKAERGVLSARANAFQAYLLAHVMPTLTHGMLRILEEQPGDPIDFLADFLVKQGRLAEARAEAQARLQHRGLVAKAKWIEMMMRAEEAEAAKRAAANDGEDD